VAKGSTLFFVRILPVAMVVAAAAFWFSDVQDDNQYLLPNLVPLAILLLLSWLTLYRGGGAWSGNGFRMPLATLGFAIPALGLSVYLHYAYAVNLNGMFTDALFPGRVFRYLPIYTLVAGGIGFAIGWIVGRNV
jgi:hypothetical protein